MRNNKRFIQYEDACYWKEIIGHVDGTPVYEVRPGYYLASYRYENNKKIMHIVSNGGLGTTVVRHIEDGHLFFTPENAQRDIDGLPILPEYSDRVLDELVSTLNEMEWD